MAKATKLRRPPKAVSPKPAEPAKKLYLIRADDVADFEPWPECDERIMSVHMKPEGRIVVIDDNPEGRNVLASNIRRIVGDMAVSRLLTGTPGRIDSSDPPKTSEV